MVEVLTMKKLQEQINELKKEIEVLQSNTDKSVCIKKSFSIGDEFELADIKWKILDITEKGYVCFGNFIDDSRKFDNNTNNWKESSLRKWLNENIFKKLSNEIGEENILEFDRDLLSLDGQTEYGTCRDRVSLISFDEYRKYRKLIFNSDKWFWTITPDSTACNGDTSYIRIVSPSGIIHNCNYCIDCGVRPFCIFCSAIFESED